MNTLMRNIFVSLLGVFILAGCQGQPAPDVTEVQQHEGLPTPSIKGPSEPPHVNGPTSAPPNSLIDDTTPQSMTETETVEYSLPTTDAGFKN